MSHEEFEELTTPLSEDQVRNLHAGDVVRLTGSIYTFRDAQHIRAFQYMNEGKEIPVDLQGQVIWHCGPAYQVINGKYRIVAAGPTTSFRVNKFEPETIRRFGIRGVIGKGGMDDATLEVMKERGCVYFLAVGGCAADFGMQIKEVLDVHWEDLKGESIFHLGVKRFGPLFVTMDSHGRSLHHEVAHEVEKNLSSMFSKMDVTTC